MEHANDLNALLVVIDQKHDIMAADLQDAIGLGKPTKARLRNGRAAAVAQASWIARI